MGVTEEIIKMVKADKKYSAFVRVCKNLESREKTQSTSGDVVMKNAMQLKVIIKNLAK